MARLDPIVGTRGFSRVGGIGYRWQIRRPPGGVCSFAVLQYKHERRRLVEMLASRLLTPPPLFFFFREFFFSYTPTLAPLGL